MMQCIDVNTTDPRVTIRTFSDGAYRLARVFDRKGATRDFDVELVDQVTGRKTTSACRGPLSLVTVGTKSAELAQLWESVLGPQHVQSFAEVRRFAELQAEPSDMEGRLSKLEASMAEVLAAMQSGQTQARTDDPAAQFADPLAGLALSAEQLAEGRRIIAAVSAGTMTPEEAAEQLVRLGIKREVAEGILAPMSSKPAAAAFSASGRRQFATAVAAGRNLALYAGGPRAIDAEAHRRCRSTGRPYHEAVGEIATEMGQAAYSAAAYRLKRG